MADRNGNNETESSDRSTPKDQDKLKAERERFVEEVEAKGRRHRQARAEGDRTLRSGFASFGVVGWSIAVPAVLGMVVGRWIDARVDGGFRYSMSFFVLGLIIGSVNAWNWMNSK